MPRRAAGSCWAAARQEAARASCSTSASSRRAVNGLWPLSAYSRLTPSPQTSDGGAGIPVTMCGEMAGDPRFTKLLLAMGLRIFSMDPTTLLEVKKKVLSADIAGSESRVEEILSCGDTQALRGLVTALDG